MIDESVSISIWVLFVVILVLITVMGCIGSAIFWHSFTGAPAIRDLLKRYRTEGLQVPGVLLHQERIEIQDVSGSSVTARTRILYKVKYQYGVLSSSTVVRQVESPKEIETNGFTVLVLPGHPHSGLPSQYVPQPSDRRSAMSGVFLFVFALVGLSCVGLTLYAMVLFKVVVSSLGLALVTTALLAVGKLIANEYHRREKESLLETILENDLTGPSYGTMSEADGTQ